MDMLYLLLAAVLVLATSGFLVLCARLDRR